MTAEIAILNRVGVALAADSAVTISSSHGEPKTYNSADKLFQLDGDEPVGIMIHGSAEFMGIPAETIVKGFCASTYNTPQPELAGYVRQFLDFMRHDLPIERTAMIRRISGIAVDVLVGIRSEAEDEYDAMADRAKSRRPKPAVFMARRTQEIAGARLKVVQATKPLPGVTEANLPVELREIVEQAVSTVLGEGLLDRLDPFLELIRLMLLSEIQLGGEIGFVFAGFGTGRIFPALQSFECDLALVDALRVRQRGDAVISNESVAIISPFAQSEMVERFMDGADSSYVTFVRSVLREALSQFGSEVATRFGGDDHPEGRGIAKALEALRDDYVREIEHTALIYRQTAYRQKVLEVVQFMPKAELAEMAESLVNLTSIKRRVSAEHESVGGPIDVAFVSKHDGFTWVRRKGATPRIAGNGGGFFTNQERQR